MNNENENWNEEEEEKLRLAEQQMRPLGLLDNRCALKLTKLK